jgi:hypothetical protein
MNQLRARGFLFEHTRSDASSPDGVRRTRIAVVAPDRKEAFALAGGVLPTVGLRLIDEGPDALKAARDAGLADGEAQAIA